MKVVCVVLCTSSWICGDPHIYVHGLTTKAADCIELFRRVAFTFEKDFTCEI